jgi:site-specific recombinase XerC
MLFDWLVAGEVLAVNPAHTVRGPKHVVKRRKTPVLTEEQLAIRSTASTRRPRSGCATHALIGVMTYSFARIGAVVAMRVEDYFPNGKRWWVRLHETGGKRHEMPAHQELEHFLDEYLAAAGIRDDSNIPLFRERQDRDADE